MAYTPAGNLTTSPGLAHMNVVSARKKGLDHLMKKFVFRMAAENDTLEKQSGRTVQWYRTNLLGPNTTQTTEGTVGTSLQYTSNILQATVGQYSDFMTVSDLLLETSIAPELDNAALTLSYRAAYSVDKMTRMVIDAEYTGTAFTPVNPAGYATASDLRAMWAGLQAVDVEPFDNSEFLCIMHPFVVYDLLNDPAVNGLADIYKHTDPGAAGLIKLEDRGTVTHVADAKVIISTNVAQPAASTYRTYYFGKGGIGVVNLAGEGPSDVRDPKKQRFKIFAKQITEPSVADPEGVIGGWVSYNFKFVPVVMEGPAGIGGTYRFKLANHVSSIG